ncbi:divergent polysaccharide deacetylase family protein [Marinobacterium jannaschii]|uniref:divergent polysaccharide deacetylase family protein n=1 Tax=Marinobacterium jannaschii TaxID=64970 RepID=UPI0004862B1C|nr:divergent polysaccharide deacetylase family protein [Marinobacterium jannaschii]
MLWRCLLVLLYIGTGSLSLCASAETQPADMPQAEAAPYPPVTKRLVLILDDLGNNLRRGREAVALPGPISYAILPHTPHARSLAKAVHQSGRTVMLHLPMANNAGLALGPGALLPDQPRQKLQSVMREAVAAVPYVEGFNNHMGSLLTRQPQAMQWVMEEARRLQLFFVDSYTTVGSVAWQKARENQIPSLRRHVFLDHRRDRQAIAHQFQRAVRLAEQQPVVVVIGHPYPETLSYLAERLPRLRAQGIELVELRQQLQPLLALEGRP